MIPEVAVDRDGRPLPELPEGAPAWMARAFADEPRRWTHMLDGAALEVLEWGTRDAPPLVLVHGQAAHADWWRFIAPLLAEGRRVLVPSLSGMGGSDWCAHYGIERHARELVALLDATDLGDGVRPAIAAHSYGCGVALAAARRAEAPFASLALLDLYIQPPGIEPRYPPPRRVRRYASMTEALSRFRLAPPQACENAALLDYIARRTLRLVEEGGAPAWSWVSDPAAVVPTDHDAVRADLAAFDAPLLIARGERSGLVDAAIADHVRSVAPPQARFVDIPDADHHVLLDQPLATVALLRTWLATAEG